MTLIALSLPVVAISNAFSHSASGNRWVISGFTSIFRVAMYWRLL